MTDETLPTNNDFFGTPSAPGSYGFKFHAISDKEPSIYRIAPPIKSQRLTGKWYTYDSLHQGYTIPNEQDPSKPKWKPFRCIFKRDRNKMVTQDCPECTRMDEEKKLLEDMVTATAARLMAATPGLTEEAAKTQAATSLKTSAQAVLVDKFYTDRKYYVLAKNVAGEWGILKLPPSLIWGKGQKGDLAVLMDKFSADNGGASLLDPNVGVWLRFQRTGSGRYNTRYTVAIETESVGGGAFRYKMAPLNGSDVAGLEKCPDLGTYNDDKTLTYDQILTLARSNNDVSIVSSVFGSSGRRTPPPAMPAMVAAPAPRPMPPPAPVVVPVVVPVVAPAPVVVPAALPTVQEDELTRLRRQIAEMEARNKAAAAAPQPATQPVVAAAPATAAPAVGGKSFTEMMGLNPQAFLDMFPDANKK